MIPKLTKCSYFSIFFKISNFVFYKQVTLQDLSNDPQNLSPKKLTVILSIRAPELRESNMDSTKSQNTVRMPQINVPLFLFVNHTT